MTAVVPVHALSRTAKEQWEAQRCCERKLWTVQLSFVLPSLEGSSSRTAPGGVSGTETQEAVSKIILASLKSQSIGVRAQARMMIVYRIVEP